MPLVAFVPAAAKEVEPQKCYFLAEGSHTLVAVAKQAELTLGLT